MKLKAALIVDNLKIENWQQSTLDAINSQIDVVLILNCKNTKNKRAYVKNFLYYVLNIFSLRNYFTQKNKLRFASESILNFESIYEGIWQSFPKKVYGILEDKNVDIVIKFGMSLLRISDKLSAPIFSFHHGDPSKYRGRPGGFYEIINGEKTCGIIVQELSNKLDAGKILAFTESKIINFSYKKTAENFYRNSEFLLKTAIENWINSTHINLNTNGKNYRLPSNLQVLKFILLIFKNGLRRFLYGLFFEKRWKVAFAENNLSLEDDELINLSDFLELPIKKKYNLYADPFFSEDGNKIRVEALDNKSGLGDILEINTKDFSNQSAVLTGKHFSYPFSFTYNDEEFLMPEVSGYSPQYFYPANQPNKKFFLRGLEEKRIVDATLLFHDNIYFLFFCEVITANSILNLWYARSPFDKFKPHPKSPVSTSPFNARMGGKFIVESERIIRFGQNNAGEYGESLSVMEIRELNLKAYEEIQIGTIKIKGFKGPHSLAISSDKSKILIDFYINKFSVFAGIRRFKASIKNSRQHK